MTTQKLIELLSFPYNEENLIVDEQNRPYTSVKVKKGKQEVYLSTSIDNPSMSLGTLLESLRLCDTSYKITNSKGKDFIHISNDKQGNTILSTLKPIGICNRSGGNVYPSVLKGYKGYSIELDEDLYEFEFIKK